MLIAIAFLSMIIGTAATIACLGAMATDPAAGVIAFSLGVVLPAWLIIRKHRRDYKRHHAARVSYYQQLRQREADFHAITGHHLPPVTPRKTTGEKGRYLA